MGNKSIINAIASLRADLDRLEAQVKEDEFVPGWYLYWDMGTDARNLKYIDSKEVLQGKQESWRNVQYFSAEIAAQFLPKKTRYNWPEIVKRYPEAQWASTDEDGRVCYWIKKPRKAGFYSSIWVSFDGCINPGDYGKKTESADYWADSLEKRPDYL